MFTCYYVSALWKHGMVKMLCVSIPFYKPHPYVCGVEIGKKCVDYVWTVTVYCWQMSQHFFKFMWSEQISSVQVVHIFLNLSHTMS